jgi:hypothetical protein
MFQQVIAIVRGSKLPQKLLKQYPYCGCMWIAIHPVWSGVRDVTKGLIPHNWPWWMDHNPYTCTIQILLEQLLRKLRPSDDGSDLLKNVGVNLECINKSYYFLDAFVCYFTMVTMIQQKVTMIQQKCSVHLSRWLCFVSKLHICLYCRELVLVAVWIM